MIGSPLQVIQWLYSQDKDKKFEIKEHKEKRSLNANAYAWVLIGKIAEVVGNTKEEVYREYIKNKGIYRIITIYESLARSRLRLVM